VSSYWKKLSQHDQAIFKEYVNDTDKKASIIAWLNDSPSTPDIPIEDQEIIKVHCRLLQYKNEEGNPRIEDTELVPARSLLSKANNISNKLTSLKQSLTKISRILKGFNILVEETLSEKDKLKKAMDAATPADNVKTDEQKAKDVSEQIIMEPDIYINSGPSSSQMEVQEVIDVTTNTDSDSKTSEVSVNKWGRCIEKERKPAKGHPDSMVLLH